MYYTELILMLDIYVFFFYSKTILLCSRLNLKVKVKSLVAESHQTPAPWIHDPEIRHLQKIRDECRVEARQTQAVGDSSRNSPPWEKFRESKRAVKKAVRKAKATFYRKALSKQNKKEVWKVIHSVLHPPAKHSTLSPSVLNKYFATVANKTLNKKAVPIAETKHIIDGLTNNDKESFFLHQTT